jgi:hypothetical protein
MLGTTGLGSILNLGKIIIYSGTAPATADAAINTSNSTVLATITNNGGATGLTFAAPDSGTVTKTSSEVWQGTVVASGVASFFRHVLPTDLGDTNTTAIRVQGSVALNAGGDLNLTSTSLALNAIQSVDYYAITLPTL